MSLLSFQALHYGLLGYMHLVVMLLGLRVGLNAGWRPLDGLFSVVFALAAAMFCVLDARVLRVRLPQSCHQLFLVLWPAAVLVYLFWSRGLRGIHWALLLVGSVLLTMILSGFVGFVLASALRRM
jgi:hypothetical protein